MDNSELFDAIRRRRSKRYQEDPTEQQDEAHVGDENSDDGLAPTLKASGGDQGDQAPNNVGNHQSAAGVASQSQPSQQQNPASGSEAMMEEAVGMFKQKANRLNSDKKGVAQNGNVEEPDPNEAGLKGLSIEDLEDLAPSDEMDRMEESGRAPRGLWQKVQKNLNKIKKQKKGEVKR